MDVVDEIISIYAASHRYMENIPTESLVAFEEGAGTLSMRTIRRSAKKSGRTQVWMRILKNCL